MTEAVLALEDVQFRWRRDDAVLLDIPRLSLAKGERVFIHGPSGSGKTTLLNLLGGLALPQRGRITILGEVVSEMSGSRRDGFRADHLGFIFQIFNLVPYLSPIDNVVLPLRFSALRRDRAQDRAGSPTAEAERLLSHMGLDSAVLARRSTADLSVGQQQRVAAARALIGDPEILIADEPTSALDGAARGAFLDLLFREVARCASTVIFVSHDERLAPAFDRAIALGDLGRTG